MLSKIEIPNVAIRFLTLACYFLPFVFFFTTCVDGVSKDAFNKKDAIANEREKSLAQQKDLLNSVTDVLTNKLTINDSTIKLDSETLDLLENRHNDWGFYPTYTSLSAIGVIFLFKNAFGQTLTGISLFLSLITFVIWRFLKKKLVIYIIGLNLFVMLLFVCVCLIENVTILFGAWAVLFLLIIQLLTEIQERKKINPTLEGINPN